jgi:hypothetical protein
MSEQNFLDELKKMMDVDKDGTYSTFKPLQSVEEAKRQEQLMGALRSMGDMDFRPQAINAPAMGGMQRGGGMIPIQQVQMSDPAGQMGQAVKGLMESLGDAGMTQPPGYPGGSGGSEEGPMLGGLLDMLMKIGQVKNLF